MDIGAWLRDLGLERYAPTFREHEVDLDVLGDLTEADLETLGIPLGHRRKLLRAIARLAEPGTAAAESPRTEAERRQLTVLFVDLVGSTELSTRLDPEDLGALIRAFQECCAGVVKRWDGHLAKFMGDGVLAYFGWPRAHEEDVERAVRAGLELAKAVSDLAAPADTRLAARIGIATGAVIVGELIGEGAAQEEAVVGETPNLAARLQGLAAPGTVVVAARTRRLLGELFTLTDLGPVRLKGFADGLAAFRVEGEGRSEGRFEALRGGRLTPLVGREHELAILLERWAWAREGDGQVVLLAGEPGIGKSRLIRALREALSGEPHVALSHFCSPYHTNSALHPVITQLGRAAGLTQDDQPETRLAKLEALLGKASDQLDEAIPLLAALLEIPLGDRYPALSLSPQRRKQRTLEILIEQLAGLARGRPVLELYEDLHWVDPSTLELLDLLVERVRRLPVLVVLTYRPEFGPPWTGQANVTTLPLNRLGRRQGAALVARLTGGKALPDEVLGQILAKTDGVPLFVEELTKTVLESGLLQDAGDRLVLSGRLPPLAIPASLHDSLMARLDRLAALKEVAQIAAVIGREFSHGLLAAVAPMAAAHLNDALERLVDSELVFSRGVPPEATYSFKHALVQDAAYQSLLKSRRQQLHGRIFEVLSRTDASSTELLAQHAAAAGRHAEALDLFESAGREAHLRGAQREAAAHYVSALAALEQLGDRFAGRDAARARLLLGRGTAVAVTDGWRRAAVLADVEGAIVAAEASGEHEVLFAALFALWAAENVGGDHRAALSNAERVVAAALRYGEPRFESAARAALGCSLLLRGRIVDAEPEFRRAIAIHPRDPTANSARSRDYRLYAFCLSAIGLWHLGYPEQALLKSEEGVARAEACLSPLDKPMGRAFAAQLAVRSRDPSRAEANAEVALSAARRYGSAHLECDAKIYQGWAFALRGQTRAGQTLIDDALETRRQMGAFVAWPSFLSWRAEVLALGGDTAAALGVVEEALEHAARMGELEWLAELHRQRAELGMQLGRGAASAETELGRALEVARGQGTRMLELRAATSLARLWTMQRERQQAHDLLAPIHGGFTEGFDTADLKEAKALLDELQ